MFFDKAIVIMIDDEYFTHIDIKGKPVLYMYLFKARIYSHINDLSLKETIRELKKLKIDFILMQIGVLDSMQHI